MEDFLDQLTPIWQPHPGQREFLVHSSDRKVMACGRRWGKSDVAAVWLLSALVRTEPQKLLTVAPTLDQARLIFDRVEHLLTLWKDRYDRTAPIIVRRTPYPVLHYGKSSLSARSCHNVHRLRGQEATRIVVDEAAFVPGNLVPDVLIPMLATTEGELVLISSPNGQNHFWRDFQRGQASEHGYWSRRAPSQENPLVSPSFLAVQKEVLPEAVYRVEFEAEFLDASGAVFPSQLIEASLSTEISRGSGPVVLGVDWARYRDYTAIVALQNREGLTETVHIERIFREPWPVQVAKVAKIANDFNARVIACDGTGVGDPVTAMLQEALPEISVQALTFTQSLKGSLVGDLRMAFERERLKLLPDRDLLRELQHFEWRDGRLEGTSGFHDDLVMALALAYRVAPKSSHLGLLVGDMRRFARRMGQRLSWWNAATPS